MRFEPLEERRLLAASSIEILAAGATGEETMELQVDGETVATFNNVAGDAANSVFQTFNYTHPTQLAISQLRVAFTNDGLTSGGSDKNLRVDMLKLDGVQFQTEAPSTFSVGSWNAATGCSGGTKQSEFLHCNGYFEYAAVGSGSTIEIFAAGVSGEEIMVLEIDGAPVKTFFNIGGDPAARVFETFSYSHPTSVSVDRISVAFTNNDFVNGVDRNLRVDKITLDGTIFETESSTTFSTGTWDAATGCGPGNKQSEFLHCNGEFQYAAPIATGSIIEIDAAGFTGGERMELLIDGAAVAVFNGVGGDYSAGVFETFSYQHTSTVSIDQIRVALTNDGDGGADRNLRVDFLSLDSVVFQTEAPNTFSTGSWDAATGCAAGAKQSEFLHCNGAFEFAAVFNPGVLALGTSAISVSEADGTATLPVVRTGGSDGTVTLNYTTVDATATAGQDYTLTAGVVVFLPGQTTASIVVPILNDSDVEGTEEFNIATDQTTGGAIVGEPRTARIVILDDDGPPSTGNGNGLLGTYYDDINFLDSKFERADTTIDFDWGSGSPDPQIANDTFSVLWTGQVEPLFTETYTFDVRIDDGVRLWVDDQLIIDEFITQNTTHTGLIALQGGLRHDIRLEYFENSGNAQVKLRWSSASQAFETVPQSQLYSDPPSNIDGTFAGEVLVTGLTEPTAIDFESSGRFFIAQKDGVVRVFQNGQLLAQPFIDISAEVNNLQDRGLLGIALHPDFANTPYVYLLYTYDPPETASQTGLAAPDGSGNRVSRLVRYTADAANGFNTALPGSEVVILGTNSTWANISHPELDSTNNISLDPSCGGGDATLDDCLATDSRSHSIGSVVFGTDGMLYVSNGDGTSFGQVDPRTTRVQNIDSLSGKILRIDPITGAGLSDNPFYNGDPGANRSKVYSYGLRNPFRMAVRPEDGEPYVGDVGWNGWEELNAGRAKNFGWPFYEGGDGQNLQTGGYQNLPEATAFYASNNATPSLFSRSHADGGVAIVNGDFYSGSSYPAVLDSAMFFTDFGDPTIRAAVLNADGSLNRVLNVADSVGNVVEMSMGLDDHMYYVDLVAGTIGRFVFTPSGALSAGGESESSELSEGTNGGGLLAWQRNFSSTTAEVAQQELAAWQSNFGGTNEPIPAPLVAPVAVLFSEDVGSEDLVAVAQAHWSSQQVVEEPTLPQDLQATSGANASLGQPSLANFAQAATALTSRASQAASLLQDETRGEDNISTTDDAFALLAEGDDLSWLLAG